jgi:hypothetical protein
MGCAPRACAGVARVEPEVATIRVAIGIDGPTGTWSQESSKNYGEKGELNLHLDLLFG